jgi:hypothetical protein
MPSQVEPFPRRPASGGHVARAAALALVLVFTGCKVKLIADYDPVLDGSATDLSTRTSAFLSKMEVAAGTPAGSFAANQAFYADVQGQVTTLKLRSDQQEKSERIKELLDLLTKSVDDLRLLHERSGDAGLRKALIDPARSALETQFKALFTLENALRRGQ